MTEDPRKVCYCIIAKEGRSEISISIKEKSVDTEDLQTSLKNIDKSSKEWNGSKVFCLLGSE